MDVRDIPWANGVEYSAPTPTIASSNFPPISVRLSEERDVRFWPALAAGTEPSGAQANT